MASGIDKFRSRRCSTSTGQGGHQLSDGCGITERSAVERLEEIASRRCQELLGLGKDGIHGKVSGPIPHLLMGIGSGRRGSGFGCRGFAMVSLLGSRCCFEVGLPW